MQYTLAVDRGNARLAERFTPHHPAMLRQLKMILDAGREHDIAVSVCGEMASDPLSAVLLMGLGYRVLSVAPPSLPLLKWVVRTVPVKRRCRRRPGPHSWPTGRPRLPPRLREAVEGLHRRAAALVTRMLPRGKRKTSLPF